mmetsp:Transcript_48403/g.95969  ORF Transcript_48403/g.95969 Transcript_48403/m.95969 type:complete len:90 (-) Transcript_48403:634-903(-)
MVTPRRSSSFCQDCTRFDLEFLICIGFNANAHPPPAHSEGSTTSGVTLPQVAPDLGIEGVDSSGGGCKTSGRCKTRRRSKSGMPELKCR